MSLEEGFIGPIQPTIDIKELASDPWPPVPTEAEQARRDLVTTRATGRLVQVSVGSEERNARQIKQGLGKMLEGTSMIAGGMVNIAVKVSLGLLREGRTIGNNFINRRPFLESIKRRG